MFKGSRTFGVFPTCKITERMIDFETSPWSMGAVIDMLVENCVLKLQNCNYPTVEVPGAP